jgi:hypothetical protein
LSSLSNKASSFERLPSVNLDMDDMLERADIAMEGTGEELERAVP